MKKCISLILAGVIALSMLSGCGKDKTIGKDAFSDYDNESVVSVEGESSGIVVKEKKYDYDGNNVELLRVESRTEKNYTVKITGHFIDADGNEIKSEEKTFEGFPAGYENYFLFQPGVKYDKFTYELTTYEYSGEAYAQYLRFGTSASVQASPEIHDENGNEYKNEDDYRARLDIKLSAECTYPDNSKLEYSANFILFDSTGKIHWIDNVFQAGYATSDKSLWDGTVRRAIRMYDTLWSEYECPEELNNNAKIIVAVKYVILPNSNTAGN